MPALTRARSSGQWLPRLALGCVLLLAGCGTDLPPIERAGAAVADEAPGDGKATCTQAGGSTYRCFVGERRYTATVSSGDVKVELDEARTEDPAQALLDDPELQAAVVEGFVQSERFEFPDPNVLVANADCTYLTPSRNDHLFTCQAELISKTSPSLGPQPLDVVAYYDPDTATDEVVAKPGPPSLICEQDPDSCLRLVQP